MSEPARCWHHQAGQVQWRYKVTTVVSHLPPGYVIRCRKHGKVCVLAKVVRARPTGEVVIAMPVKRRRFATPSLPVRAIELARQSGATAWVVRFDVERRCYRISLDAAEAVGQVGDDGELYVPMARFEPWQWLDWDYVERALTI